MKSQIYMPEWISNKIIKLIKRHKFPWLQISIHVFGWLPFGLIVLAYITNNLTYDPVQAATQRLGRIAFYFLIATLSVSPIYALTGWREILSRRRSLGIYAFLYASLHLFTFVGLDYGFNISRLLPFFTTKVFILLGTITYLFLISLTVTSFDFIIRRMGMNWKRLHWLIYPSGLLVTIHYGMSLKGSFFTLRGNVLQPLLWGLFIVFLLVCRIPPVRKWIIRIRMKLSVRVHCYTQRRTKVEQ
jgi:sulfoxide reductase heme-binding subunit YedZ